MDKGRPFRAPQPTDRRVASRPSSTVRQQEDPILETTPPKASSGEPKPEKESPKYLMYILIAAVSLILIGALAWFAWSGIRGSNTAIDSSKYQAVFFTNGQVYFGKLQILGSDQMRLTDVYYLQNQQTTTNESDSENPQETASDQGDVQLIKLGNEIHGPEDEMIISRDQVLFYENLKPDGKVSQSISEHKSSN